MTTGQRAAEAGRRPGTRRRPRGAVRDGLLGAGLELARTGGPDAVVLREATRMVGVVPNAAYRHFADRDELLAAVCGAAMNELADRMAAAVARVPGAHGDPAAARHRLSAIGTAYLEFARSEPGLFATAFALPQRHAYDASDPAGGGGGGGDNGDGDGDGGDDGDGNGHGHGHGHGDGSSPDRTPLGRLRAALNELVDAGVLDPRRREGLEYPVWSAVHGIAVLTGRGPVREIPEATRRQLEQRVLEFIDGSITG